MKSKVNPIRKKKHKSVQKWIGLIVVFFCIVICICFSFYMLFSSSTDNLTTLLPLYNNTELPPVILATDTSITNPLIVPTPSVTPLPQPTYAPTWTPEPTFTPFVLSTPQIIDQPSNSKCTWTQYIEGKWVSDLYNSIFTYYPNGEFVEEEKILVEAGIDMPAPGKYECTSEGYLRMHRDGQDIFSHSLRVNIEGNKMIWNFIDSPLSFSIPFYRE